MSPEATVHSVQIREAKATGAQRAADGRVVEVKSENEDEVEVENMPASALPKRDDAPTELTDQDNSEQPLQTVAPAEAVVDIDNTAEHSPVLPTPVTTSVVPVAAT